MQPGTKEASGMGKGVWVKTDVIEGKLTVHPVSTLERPAYRQFLSKHFACLDHGFFLRATRDHYDTCSCFSSADTSVTYDIFSPLSHILFSGSLFDPEVSSHSMTSSIDSDSEIEELSESVSILLSDQKNKCLIRINYCKGNFHKEQVARVESPPGILLGWIQKRRRCFSSNWYHLYEGNEPIQPNMILRRCSKLNVSDDDDESHDIGCFSCLFPCSHTSLKSNLFEVQDVLVTDSKTQSAQPGGEAIGMIFGSHQGGIGAKIGNEENITCSFNPGISHKKKVLILTAVIVVHLNRDIA